MRIHESACVLVLACCAVGCQSQPSEPAPKQTESRPPPFGPTPPPLPPSDHADVVAPPPTSKQSYTGPPVKVQLLQLQTYPPQNQVNIDIIAPTGGWSLELDEGNIVDRVAKIYLTLERPGDGEMVTQALVGHTKSFITTEPFSTAEVYVHLAQRGVQTLTTDYRLAANAK